MVGRTSCSRDLPAHVVHRDEPLVVQVPALLWKLLIFDLDARRTDLLQLAHGTHDVEDFSKARVTVDDEGKVGRSNDLARAPPHILERQDAKVREAHGRRERGAGQIQGLEPGLPREAGG